MRFQQMSISRWQQFEKVDLDFSNRLTVITGANGSGKTTLLNILAKHYNWAFRSLATPKRNNTTGKIEYIKGLFGSVGRENEIGEIRYSNNEIGKLILDEGSTPEYSIKVAPQQPVRCFFIPSHRTVYRYQALHNIPTKKKDKNTAFLEVYRNNSDAYQGESGYSNSFLMKSALIGWMIQGHGVRTDQNEIVMPGDSSQKEHFYGFEEVLRKILPNNIGFKHIEVRNMEIVFVCNEGQDDFLLETASGGISAIIDIAWQIFMFSTSGSSDCTVIVDEIENHLHPSMQRKVLPDLLDAFPKVKFIISTHSPLVISSCKEATIYALRYGDKGKVYSDLLDLKKRAKTAAEILDEVLGVSVTMPIWAEDELKLILSEFSNEKLSKDSFRHLRERLENAGLGRFLPDAIECLAEEATGQ